MVHRSTTTYVITYVVVLQSVRSRVLQVVRTVGQACTRTWYVAQEQGMCAYVRGKGTGCAF
jgi:uncharacterized protein affecting Mg2+/Co2+ transport